MWFNIRSPSPTSTDSTPGDWLAVTEGGHETVSIQDVLCPCEQWSSDTESEAEAGFVLVGTDSYLSDWEVSSTSSDRSIRLPPSPSPSPSPSPPPTPPEASTPTSYSAAVMVAHHRHRRHSDGTSNTKSHLPFVGDWDEEDLKEILDTVDDPFNVYCNEDSQGTNCSSAVAKAPTSAVSTNTKARLGHGMTYTGRRCGLALIGVSDITFQPRRKDYARVAAYINKRGAQPGFTNDHVTREALSATHIAKQRAAQRRVWERRANGVGSYKTDSISIAAK